MVSQVIRVMGLLPAKFELAYLLRPAPYNSGLGQARDRQTDRQTTAINALCHTL